MKLAHALMRVEPLDKKTAAQIVIEHHYLHRRPPISFSFGLFEEQKVCGVITFGTPASRHMLIGAWPENPSGVIELNRLWVDDRCQKNTETWFMARALLRLPPRIVLSYADTAFGHVGTVYKAANFFFAGWTDMDRKTPRFDYVCAGKHSRDAFRSGFTERVRRKPKLKYWTTTGNHRERRDLVRACRWPRLPYEDISKMVWP